MSAPVLAAVAVWAVVLTVGWHYLVAPFPRVARRRSMPRRRRAPGRNPDATGTMRPRPQLLARRKVVLVRWTATGRTGS